MRFASCSAIERRADLRCRRVCYTALKEPPAKQMSAMPETHFAAGQRRKASSSNSANKQDQRERLIFGKLLAASAVSNAISAAIQELPTRVSVSRSVKDSEDPESNLAA